MSNPVLIEQIRAVVQELMPQRPRIGTILSLGGGSASAIVKILETGQRVSVLIPRGMQQSAVVGDVIYLMYFGTAVVGYPYGQDQSVVPSGLIAIFDTSCPTGWTQVSAFDGLFLRGSATYGGTGGASTHTHSHTHGVGTLSHSHITGSNLGGVGTQIVAGSGGSDGDLYTLSGGGTSRAVSSAPGSSSRR